MLDAAMRYLIEFYQSDEGFAVCAPSLPGCWSQGATQEEAIENICVAIREYLDDEPPRDDSAVTLSRPSGGPALSEVAEIREIEITD
jgi:predicted RNase H-like HicB family nuclease